MAEIITDVSETLNVVTTGATTGATFQKAIVRTLVAVTCVTGLALSVTCTSFSAAMAPPAVPPAAHPNARHATPPFAAEVTPEVEKARFDALAAQWKEDTVFDSSVRDMIAHPAHLQIIAMGERAVPWLLREMATAAYHWDAALTAITGEDPVPEVANGDLDAIATAWVHWGRTRGYVI